MDDWEKLRRLAARNKASAVLAWLATNDALVRRQIELHAAFDGFPRGNGGCEAVVNRVREWLEERRFNFRNLRRFETVLELMRLEVAGESDPVRYGQIVRSVIDATTSHSRDDWTRAQDAETGMSSLARVIADARARWKAGQADAMLEAQAKSVEARVAALNVARLAQGLLPLVASRRSGVATEPRVIGWSTARP